jgi:hypothetical protein
MSQILLKLIDILSKPKLVFFCCLSAFAFGLFSKDSLLSLYFLEREKVRLSSAILEKEKSILELENKILKVKKSTLLKTKLERSSTFLASNDLIYIFVQ